jgi:hypothetical protein
MNKTGLLLIFIVLIGCDKSKDVINPLPDKLIGTYEGYLNYSGSAAPGGGNTVQPVTFTIVRHGENDIKISTNFDLVIQATRSFQTKNGEEIITLGEGQHIQYDSNGTEITCGGSTWNNWGEMCGYYTVEAKELIISFAFNDGTTGGGGLLQGIKK